jgi:hypothetical protein
MTALQESKSYLTLNYLQRKNPPTFSPPQDYSITACGDMRVDAIEECDPPGRNCSARCLFNASMHAVGPLSTSSDAGVPSSPLFLLPSTFQGGVSWTPPFNQTIPSSGILSQSMAFSAIPSVTIAPTVPGLDPTVRGPGVEAVG